MHQLIDKLFQKRGIKNINELDPEEKATFDGWNKVLSKDELTLEDVKEFCKSQVEIIEGKWKDLEMEQTKKSEMIPYHTVYRTLLSVIDSPKVAREALEKQLEQLLK